MAFFQAVAGPAVKGQSAQEFVVLANCAVESPGFDEIAASGSVAKALVVKPHRNGRHGVALVEDAVLDLESRLGVPIDVAVADDVVAAVGETKIKAVKKSERQAEQQAAYRLHPHIDRILGPVQSAGGGHVHHLLKLQGQTGQSHQQ